MAFPWAALVQVAIGAYSANRAASERKKIASEAAKGTTTTQTSVPYMNEYIAKLIPYILQEQQKIYESRLKGYGLKPGDYSPIASMLSGISPSYTGVGGGAGGAGGASGDLGPGYGGVNVLSQQDRDKLNEYAEQNNVSRGQALMDLYGTGNREKISNVRGDGFDTGSSNPFGAAGFTGVPAGDAKGAGDWVKGQFESGKSGDWLMKMLFGFGFGSGTSSRQGPVY